MNRTTTIAAIKALPGMTARCVDGEYRVTYTRDEMMRREPMVSVQEINTRIEAVACYTNDASDALNTARAMASAPPPWERAQWDGKKLLNGGGPPLWSGKGNPPPIGSTVDVGKGLTVKVERYSVDAGWLMILGVRSDGKRGNLAGAEIVWPAS